MTEIRRTKRSRNVALTTLTAAGTLALPGCGGGDGFDAEGQVFATVAECVGAGVGQAECDSAYQQALADNNNDAPRFESQDLCEDEFGAGGCEPQASGGGSIWVPLLAGFMIANVASDFDIDRRKRKYAPLYRNRSDGTWYTGGSNYGSIGPRSSGRYGIPSSTLDRPTSAPRMTTRSDIASRGGFGGRASSRSGGGGS